MTVLAASQHLRHALSQSDATAVAHCITVACASEVVPTDTVLDALSWLVHRDAGSDAVTASLRTARQNLGRVALALSGGASLGFFHLGVIKALHEHNALPDLISGSSIGAMVAAGICVRTNDELDALFTDIHLMRRDGLAFGGLRNLLSTGTTLSAAQLRRVLDVNIGDHTFTEAHRRTGRTLAVTVSPTRPGQAPRLLTYTTAPHTTLIGAVMASSALPGLFPPTRLTQRFPDGSVSQSRDTWADGSLRYDVPRDALIADHGAGVVVASQTNLHVLPFVAGGRLLKHIGRARGAARHTLRLPRRLTAPTPLGPSLEHLHDLVAQNYAGDIDIVPRLRPLSLAKVVRNPSLNDLKAHIAEGERATLPKLADIQRALRIRRALDAALIAMSPEVERAAK